MNNPTLEVVVGGQYGSEAKGHVTQRLAERALAAGRYPHIIRVAGPNAGHTGYDAKGKAWALRQVPIGSVIDGMATLGIAAGSEIDPPVLIDELDRLGRASLLKDKVVWISEEATIIEDRHKIEETGLIGAIGSTGKGIGAARADRLRRGAMQLKMDQTLIAELESRGVFVAPSRFNPRSMCHSNQSLIIEGTQGFGLGLRAGHYPQVTSSDCRAIDFLAMAGVNPWEFDRTTVWVVARVYPIRVAGNSGPLKDETSWEELGLPQERTTVTKKVRRVGGEDWNLVRDAVEANGPVNVQLALTMLDQKFPQLANRALFLGDADVQAYPTEWKDVKEYLRHVQTETGSRIGLVTTGPNTGVFL